MSEQTDSADTARAQDPPAGNQRIEATDQSTETPESDPDSAVVEIELPTEDDLPSAVETLEDTFGTVTVRAVSDGDSAGEGLPVDMTVLTEKQLEALRIAYHGGYFERPREQSATDIADSLGVSHSTFLRHLRAAQANLFGEQFD
jgi:predicted DNA binding protein